MKALLIISLLAASAAVTVGALAMGMEVARHTV